LKALAKPLLRNDLVYHVVVTKSADFLLAQRTLKMTRIQLNEIRRRFGTGLTRFDLPQGLQIEFDLSNDLDAFMYDYLQRYGHYEREVESVLSELITKDTTFIDAGANVGYFTLLASRSAKEVYAFEPVPAVFQRLSRNIGLNGLGNVRALQLALSRERAKLRLFESKISPGHDSTVKRFEHDRSIMVDAVSIDEVVDPSVADVVMKVDVEGSEMDVLLGAQGLLRSGKVSAIVLEWARGLYPDVANLRERFALYSSLGAVEVLDGTQGRHVVRDRHELPDICNLLIRVRR
jgi:FkbM family methyltransferase